MTKMMLKTTFNNNNDDINDHDEQKVYQEEEYNDDFAQEEDNNEIHDVHDVHDAITINYEKINAQMKRAKELKEIIKMEEEYIENMFNIDVVATTHSKLEKLAQGLCKNALTQTFERAEFGT